MATVLPDDEDRLERSLRQFPLAYRPPLGAAPYAIAATPGLVDTTQTSTTVRTGGGGTHGSTSFRQASPRALENMDAGDALAAREVDYVRKLGATEAAQAGVQAQDAEEAAKVSRVQQQALADRQAEHDARIEAKQKQYDEEAAKWSNDKPSSFWADKSSGEKFLAGLGVALGALGSGLTGRENGALSVLEKAQQDHYTREKDRIEKRYKGLEMLRGQRADLQAAKERDIDQLRGRYLGYWDWAQKQTDAKLKKLGLSDEAAKTDIRALQVEKARNAARQQILNDESKTITSGWSSERPSTSTTTTTLEGIKGGGGAAATEQERRNNELDVQGPGGVTLFRAKSQKIAESLNKGLPDYRELVAAAEDLKRSYATHGREFNLSKTLQTDEASLRETALARLQMVLKSPALEDLGALSGPDMGKIVEQVGSPYGWTDKDPTPKIDQLLKGLQRNMRAKIDAAGADGAKVLPRLTEEPATGAAGGAPTAPGASGLETVRGADGKIHRGRRLPDGSFEVME
jgi:hypothetical protein